jgi:hypothetical protein
MPQLDRTLVRFARALIAGETATRLGSEYKTVSGATAAAEQITLIIRSGAMTGDGSTCRANAATPGWLKRNLLDGDHYAAQHGNRTVIDDTIVNTAESPLARLATARGSEGPFLERHHLEAGERVRRLFERAQLRQRVTMTYSASRTAGGPQAHAGDITDLAADARKALADIHRILPRDCAGVVLDVCGLLKGLQEVEAERGWPRRSGKLVLRIGLDRLAEHYGLASHAVGASSGTAHAWLGEGARPSQFG